MFYQIFLSPQVKRFTINTYNDGIYKLSHELPTELRLSIIGNWAILGKCVNSIAIKLVLQCTISCENKS